MDQRGEIENRRKVGQRVNRILAIALLLSATLLCGCGSLDFSPCSHRGSTPFRLTSESPENIYSVQLEEKFDPGYDYLIGAKVFKGGQLIAEEPRYAVRYCDDGRGFETQFSYFEWVTENVFRAGWGQRDLAAKDEIVMVRNNSNKVLSEFVVGGFGELFLVVELQPRSSVELLRKHHIDFDANAIWIAGGQFQDGQRLAENYQRFKEVGGTNFKFCVDVRDNTVVIEYRPAC